MSTGCQKDKKTDRQKDRKTFQLSYQNKSCSECIHDVRKIERQKDFSVYLSKQKLFRMSTGCQKVSQTDGQKDR